VANIVRTFRSVKHAPTAAARRRRDAFRSVRRGSAPCGSRVGARPLLARQRGSVHFGQPSEGGAGDRQDNLAEQFGRFTDRELRHGAVLRHTGDVESEMTVPELARI